MTDTEHPRSIRSFVTRAGRITEAQERALEVLWPKYGVEFGTEPLDLDAVFGRKAPRTVEIGFGNGDNLARMAAAHRERDYLGIEVHRPGVGRLLLALEEGQLTHVRLICHDAVEVPVVMLRMIHHRPDEQLVTTAVLVENTLVRRHRIGDRTGAGNRVAVTDYV